MRQVDLQHVIRHTYNNSSSERTPTQQRCGPGPKCLSETMNILLSLSRHGRLSLLSRGFCQKRDFWDSAKNAIFRHYMRGARVESTKKGVSKPKWEGLGKYGKISLASFMFGLGRSALSQPHHTINTSFSLDLPYPLLLYRYPYSTRLSCK